MMQIEISEWKFDGGQQSIIISEVKYCYSISMVQFITILHTPLR